MRLLRLLCIIAALVCGTRYVFYGDSLLLLAIAVAAVFGGLAASDAIRESEADHDDAS